VLRAIVHAATISSLLEKGKPGKFLPQGRFTDFMTAINSMPV
jgi:hypothetical protein